MSLSDSLSEISRRRTFAIISHPDAGKTTLTERLLHYGGAIASAGTVKSRKNTRYATSDWMELEKQRGISVTASVMQFQYENHVVNLLDTPGHADFSEDTYRTLTAVDSALMVIDIAKGVEERTLKLMDVCRLRTTPIITFINKLDREGRNPVEVLDEIEETLNITCAPMTWPIGMGKEFLGVYRFYDDSIHFFNRPHLSVSQTIVKGLDNNMLDHFFKDEAVSFREDIELIRGACHQFDLEQYLKGNLTPVFFGSALHRYGTDELMDNFVKYAPPPQSRPTQTRTVTSKEPKLTGFVFKIQANMDPAHHDRIAFLRITSGVYRKGMKLKNVRLGKIFSVQKAQQFLASKRENTDLAYAGDIIGLHNHGGIQVGDTFTEGEELKFTGIPSFAPELFKRVKLKDPLKTKSLLKGLNQLSEEGATQFFRPLASNNLIVGAVGVLQFDVVAYRLENEYKVSCGFEAIPIVTARWVQSKDAANIEDFKYKNISNLALDCYDNLVYLAPNNANLMLTMERWKNIKFSSTNEL